MSKPDESRRDFLKGAAAGAVASATLVPEALAQTATAPVAHTEAHGTGYGAFFNGEESQTVAAFAERLWPGAPGKPGAADANVLNYIDLALAGAYGDLREFYRHGLAQLDAYCRATYREPFRQLPPARQDEVLAVLESGKATGFNWPTARDFFNTLRTHTIEGMFADPIYGGNKDFAGWQLIGFPGAQPHFTQGEMQSKEAFTRAPITGLQARALTPPRRT